jgi:hypothetical protein
VWWATRWVYDDEMGVIETARSAGVGVMSAAGDVVSARTFEISQAQPVHAVALLRDTLEPLAEIGSRDTRRELVRLAEAALAAGEDLDLFQGRYATLVQALGVALEPRKRR